MKDIFLAYVNAINNSDLDAAMALISPDAQLLNNRYRPIVPAEGIDLIRAYISETVIAQHGHITVLDVQETENAVVAQIELTSDRIKKAGLERIKGTEKFTIADKQIKGFEFAMNLEDPETKGFLEFVKKLEANRPQ